MNDTCIEFEYSLLDENAKCPFSFYRFGTLRRRCPVHRKASNGEVEPQLSGYPSLGRTGVCSTLLELRAAVVAQSVGSCEVGSPTRCAK